MQLHSKFQPVMDTGIKFNDVSGLNDAKNEVENTILLPVRYPEIYDKFKKKIGGGILLYGPPGTGKTMFAKAIASEIDAAFFAISCSDIQSKWSGEPEKNIKELFEVARTYDRAIIFFDEFDSLGFKRNSDMPVWYTSIVNELISQIQGFHDNKNMIIIAATNCPWNLDDALLRPGRFDRKIYVPLPDREARLSIIDKQFKDVPIDDDIDIESIVDVTDGFNCADVVEFYEQMKMSAIKRGISDGSKLNVCSEDIEKVKTKVKSSVNSTTVDKFSSYE